MTDRFEAHRRRLVEAVLGSAGKTAPALRGAIEARAEAHAGRSDETVGDVPDALIPFIDKVAQFAYKTTDADVAALRRSGYSEDAIFEITLSAALGAGMARLAIGLAALEEGPG